MNSHLYRREPKAYFHTVDKSSNFQAIEYNEEEKTTHRIFFLNGAVEGKEIGMHGK